MDKFKMRLEDTEICEELWKLAEIKLLEAARLYVDSGRFQEDVRMIFNDESRETGHRPNYN